MSIRITELDTITSLQNGDYIAVDNESTGTHKFDALNIGANIGQNIANTYSSSASYAIGQYCLYDNNLYKCTTTISTPEAWNSSHWIQVTVGEGLYEKVDKVSGKGLSTNDFTDEYKQKLGGIEAGAEVNVQANWAETNTSSDSYIQNKPGNATTETSGFMSASDKQKLNGIASGAEVNVQANWTETDSSKDDYIKNKPTIDDTLSTSSTNAVENSAIATAINNVTQLVSDEATARVNAVNGEATARENADIAINEDIGEINTTLETKANIDGSYQEMSVGSAEQLISTVTVDDNAPYVFRTSGGSADIGNREEDKLIGGTIAWNQLVQNGNFASTSNWSAFYGGSFTVSNNVATIVGDGNASGSRIFQDVARKPNHKYLWLADIKTDGTVQAVITLDNLSSMYTGYVASTSWQTNATIVDSGSGSQASIRVHIRIEVSRAGTIYAKNVNLIDLTQMFGSTIADYIYGLEQANVGDGVAWFRQYFPNPYYAYDAGSLQSVNASSHNMTGFNQWDEVWELGYWNYTTGNPGISNAECRSKNPIPVCPNTTYYFKRGSDGIRGDVLFYDANDDYIGYVTGKGNNTFTTPSNCSYIKFNFGNDYGATYNNDICINISWSGYRNGEYEPYELHSYPLDDSVELRGLPKLNENNNLYYDGDEYTSDGNVTRKYGVVDLGSLTWVNATADGRTYAAEALPSEPKYDTSGTSVYNLICSKYLSITRAQWYSGSAGNGATICGSGYGTNGRIGIFDSSLANKTSTEVKTAMDGVYLVYELATSTTEEADSYTNPQIVNDFGTEEYVDAGVQAGTRDVSIPVGHYTKYPANLRDKLQHLPDLATQDGEYIITQNDNNMSLKAVDLDQKADINGYYEEMTVGSAEQLISNVTTEDSKIYTFRTTGGNIDVGDRKTEQLVGGTVAWNQTILENNHQYTGLTFTFNNNTKLWSVSGTKTSHAYAELPGMFKGSRMINGHVYMSLITMVSNPDNIPIKIGFFNMPAQNKIYSNNYLCCVGKASSTGYCAGGIENIAVGTVVNNVTFKVVSFDLTIMFGYTIADAIYAMEQAEAGSGIAWFKKYFPKSYYAYDAGSLQSVNIASGVNTGFNQWDEQWEVGDIDSSSGANSVSTTKIRSKNYISIIPNKEYYFKCSVNLAIRTRWYDVDKNYIGYSPQIIANNTFTTPTNARYLRFSMQDGYGTTYNNDICINLRWDGERDGEYEPYNAYTYNYDSSLQLRGIPSLDEFNNLVYDGDVYSSDGTVQRKYGIVDLGTLDWTINNAQTRFTTNLSFAKRFPDLYTSGSNTPVNIICSKYVTVSGNVGYDATYDKAISGSFWNGENKLQVNDFTYTDAATFKTAMNGVYLVYELATPTTEEEADPYQNPQIINDWGTEEWVDAYDGRDFLVPPGHNTQYMINLKAKLEMSPNSPDGDGEYIVRQTDGMNEYIPFSWAGEREDLIAGGAQQLISDIYEEDSEPYLFRTSGGSTDIGDREYLDAIVGGTVAFNQLVQIKDTDQSRTTSYGITLVDNRDGSFVIDGTVTANGNIDIVKSINLINTHKYIILVGSNICLTDSQSYATKKGSRILVATSSATRTVNFYVTIGESFTNYKVTPMVINLTQMFGSTIADYIYALEQANAGAGVAWFKKLFNKSYYAYNAGELKSVSGLKSHDMVGFNQWDGTYEANKWIGDYTTGAIVTQSGYNVTDYIRVLPNTTYYKLDNGSSRVLFYDVDKNVIPQTSWTQYIWVSSATNFTTPSDAYYVRFTITNACLNSFCINISWDGSRNGEYEPYELHSYPLDSDLTLRGIPKLDASNNLYYDGDIYEPDGTVTRKYGVVDLGTLNWSYSSGTLCFVSADLASVVANGTGSSEGTQSVCGRYEKLVPGTGSSFNTHDKCFSINKSSTGTAVNGNHTVGALIVKDTAYTDASTFKTAMSGVYLVYELATSTTESADLYTSPQIVNDFGTEEFVIDSEIAVPIPIGHNTRYTANLKAKLEMAPDSPDGDGDYIVRQTDGVNTYVPLIIEDVLPATPTTNGTYKLIATVTDGEVVLSWESNT